MKDEDTQKKWYVTTKGARHSYARVVHTQDCSYVPRATNAHIWTRNPLDEKDTSGLYPCERCKPTPSPETVARDKAKLREMADDQAARQREQEEKRERAEFLRLTLRDRGMLHTELDNETITFEYDGHKFEIREVDTVEAH